MVSETYYGKQVTWHVVAGQLRYSAELRNVENSRGWSIYDHMDEQFLAGLHKTKRECEADIWGKIYRGELQIEPIDAS